MYILRKYIHCVNNASRGRRTFYGSSGGRGADRQVERRQAKLPNRFTGMWGVMHSHVVVHLVSDNLRNQHPLHARPPG